MTVKVARVKIGNKVLEVDRKPTMDDSHELNKDVCGLIGENGKRMDVRDMGKHEVTKFIDNVIDHAVQNLCMNGDELRAKRPELTND